MDFSSPIFLFAFLPLIFLLYRVVPGLQWKNLLLAAASLIFYAFGQIGYMLLFLGSIVWNYIMGLLLQREADGFRKAVAVLAVIVNVSVLLLFKYTNWVVEHINELLTLRIPLPGIELPVGISFFTLKGLSYVIDVYRDRSCGTRSFLTVLLYISFFPLLPAGPVVTYHELVGQLEDRTCTAENTAAGIQRFIAGLGKKLLIGNPLALIADTVFNDCLIAGMDARLAWLGCICAAMQIYFDFSGYSDMAIGMGRMFGFRIEDNFNYPFSASSIRQFWGRWNISLGTWFAEYLYEPLGGTRQSRLRSTLTGLLIFLCIGLWHGVDQTFILWGALHGVLYLLESWGITPAARLEKWRVGRAITRMFTLLWVVVLFALFRADTLQDAWIIISAMFRFQISADSSYLLYSQLSGAVIACLCIGAVMSLGTARKLSNWMLRMPMWVQDTYMIGKRLGSLAVLALCLMSLAQGGFEPFLYFRF